MTGELAFIAIELIGLLVLGDFSQRQILHTATQIHPIDGDAESRIFQHGFAGKIELINKLIVDDRDLGGDAFLRAAQGHRLGGECGDRQTGQSGKRHPWVAWGCHVHRGG